MGSNTPAFTTTTTDATTPYYVNTNVGTNLSDYPRIDTIVESAKMVIGMLSKLDSEQMSRVSVHKDENLYSLVTTLVFLFRTMDGEYHVLLHYEVAQGELFDPSALNMDDAAAKLALLKDK